jgi:hypothetical protein
MMLPMSPLLLTGPVKLRFAGLSVVERPQALPLPGRKGRDGVQRNSLS